MTERYQRERPLGRGASSRVWLARDNKLDRLVAIKELSGEYQDDTSWPTRFDREAHVVASLAHPNIVQLYDRELPSDGPAYLVLEYVAGDTLAMRINGQPLPPREAAEIVRQLAMAMDFAHGRLRAEESRVGTMPPPAPAASGWPVQRLARHCLAVVNGWGYLFRRANLPARSRNEDRNGTAAWTQGGVLHLDLKPSNVLLSPDGTPKIADFGLAKPIGSISGGGELLGTPSYMAPEQAAGESYRFGPWTDVYGLGAILYETLTGTPPFPCLKGDTPSDTCVRVLCDDPPPLRELQPDVPRDLDAICQKCLDKTPHCRYLTAALLAEDLGRFLDDKPTLARPVGWLGNTIKWAKRRPALAALAVVIVSSLALLTWFYLDAVRQWNRAEANAARADREAEEARRHEKEALARKTEAEAERNHVLAALRKLTDKALEARLGRQVQLTDQDRQFFRGIIQSWDTVADTRGDTPEAQALRGEGRFRAALFQYNLGEFAAAGRAYRDALAVRKRLAESHPTVPEYQNDLASTHLNLGNVLRHVTKQVAEAEEQYGLALGIYTKLTTDHPSVPDYRKNLAQGHNNLGVLLDATGQPGEARKHYEKALPLREKLVESDPTVPEYQSDLAQAHNNLGAILHNAGRLAEARKHYDQTLAIREQLAQRHPAVPEYRNHLAASHYNLGILLRATAVPKALEHFREAVRIRKTLTADYPTVPEYRLELAQTHNSLGLTLRATVRRTQAEEQYREALAIYTKLAGDHPAVPDYRMHLGHAHVNLAQLLSDPDTLAPQSGGTGRAPDAEEQHRKALAIFEKLARDHPKITDYQIGLGITCLAHGQLLQNQGKPKESIPWFDRAIAALQPIHEPAPDMTKERLLLSYLGRGQGHAQIKEHGKALEDWDHAITLSSGRRQVAIRARRATSLLLAGMVAESVREVAQLTKDNKTWDPKSLYNFACIYSVASTEIAGKKQEYADRAMELLRQAVAAGHANTGLMATDSHLDPLRPRDDFEKLLADVEKKVLTLAVLAGNVVGSGAEGLLPALTVAGRAVASPASGRKGGDR